MRHWPSNRTDAQLARERKEAAYERELGEQARRRQELERAGRHPCCGELVSGGHHLMCSKRPDDEPPAHVEGQEALL